MEPLSGKASRTRLSPWHDSVHHEQPVIPTGFLMETHHRWNWFGLLSHAHSYICTCVLVGIVRAPPGRCPADDWRQLGLKSGWRPARIIQKEGNRGKICFFSLQEWIRGYENTFWGPFSSLWGKSGQFQMRFSSLRRGLIITFVYSLHSPLRRAL